MNTTATIGDRVAVYRKQKGMTQEELGALVGVTGQAVSKWENGGVPDTYLIPVLARVLDCTTDALFGMEKPPAEQSEREVLDSLFSFVSAHFDKRDGRDELFRFLFEVIWHMQCAALGSESCPDLDEIIERHHGNPQVTSQLIWDEGTTYLSLVEGFPFFCAVRDTPAIAEKLSAETEFSDFFALLADPGVLRAVIFTQRATETGLYTAAGMAEQVGLTTERFSEVVPSLVRFGLLAEDSLTLNGEAVPVYHKWSNPEIRALLMMAYQFIHARQCYYNFVCERTKPYF